MISYVIKNKKGKYFLDDGEYYWTPHINGATLFGDYKLAQCYCPSDCKVVKVEIREVKDE